MKSYVNYIIFDRPIEDLSVKEWHTSTVFVGSKQDPVKPLRYAGRGMMGRHGGADWKGKDQPYLMCKFYTKLFSDTYAGVLQEIVKSR